MIHNCKMVKMLINITYCTMKLLPYHNEKFSKYHTKSIQEF